MIKALTRTLGWMLLFSVLVIDFPAPVSSQSGSPLIPGRNINMVSGTELPGGDPYLQRQNEGTIDYSTRNSMHLLGGDNDYRSVDLPGLPGDEETGDAWLGVFKSFDGGQSWQSTLLPGYPQDASPEGLASPLHGFTAAADPTVRAGAHGMFFYSGIAFDRSMNSSVVFVARFIDLNNREGVHFDIAGNRDPIKYIDTKVLQSGTSGQFLDKTWAAVDIPRAGYRSIDLNVRDDEAPGGFVQQAGLACGNVYIAYAVFTGETKKNPSTKIMFARSLDCGNTWEKPIMIDESWHVSQGTTVAIDPLNGDVYVAWRQFETSSNANAIVVAKSTDGGRRFGKAIQVAAIPFPADQATLPQTGFEEYRAFRSSVFPTMAVDNQHRVYIAWSQRASSTELGRIYLTSSSDGTTWSSPQPIETPSAGAPSIPGGDRGQFMPALSYSGGKLALLYYDLRFDLNPNYPFGYAADIRPMDDQDWHPPMSPLGRHTVDVRLAQFTPGQSPPFDSVRVSQYFSIIDEVSGAPGSQRVPRWRQVQFNPPNLPLFDQGRKPFVGDYLDLAASPKMLYSGGQWTYNNTRPAEWHAVWTDNRDVISPDYPYDWSAYLAPGPGVACDTAGMRNQNIYSSRITEGLVLGTMGNSKYLSSGQYSSFVVFIQNLTNQTRTFHLTASQPAGGRAGFTRSLDTPISPSAEPYPPATLDLVALPYEGIVRTVLVSSSNARAQVTVAVSDISSGIERLATKSLELNPDPKNPPLIHTANGFETHNPVFESRSTFTWPPLLVQSTTDGSIVFNPEVLGPDMLNPDMLNPDMLNPDMLNAEMLSPDMLNPDMLNPDMLNPDMLNPDMLNPDMLNPDMLNPDMLNPDMLNPDMLNTPITDITWTMKNDGSVDSGFRFAPLAPGGKLPEGTRSQLFIYRTYTTPFCRNGNLDEDGANLEILANIANPTAVDPAEIVASPNQLSRIVGDAISFKAGRGEKILIKLRLWNPVTKATLAPNVGGVAVAQAVNTDGTFPPSTLVISSLSLPPATVGVYYQETLTAAGGSGSLVWNVEGTLPTGLSLTGSTLSGTPTTAGDFNFTVSVRDALGQSYSAELAMTIERGTPTISVIGGSFVFDGTAHEATATATTADGAPVSGSFSFTYAPGGGAAPVNAGTYAVTANFTSTDPNYTGAVGSGSLTIGPAAAVVTVTGGTFTYDTLPHPATAAATGVGGVVVAGSFSYTYSPGGATPPVNAGTYAVTASFTSSDGNYTAAVGTDTVTINKAGTAVSVAAAPPNPSAGQQVTLTATVAAVSPGAGIPTGVVTFRDGAVSVGTGTVNSTGQATLTTSALAVGSHTITAEYGGDGNFNPSSTSSPIGLSVSYAFIGFASPLGPAADPAPAPVYGPFNVQSNVTIKWQLSNGSGGFISDLAAVRTMSAVRSNGTVVPLYDPSTNTTGSTVLRFDSGNQQYVFNWDVTQTPAGTYTIVLELNDGKKWKVVVQTQ